MRRLLFVAITTLACTEPTRLPADIGPRDARSDGGEKDGGEKDGGLDGDSGGEDTGVTPTGICESKPCLTAVNGAAEWAFVSGPARSPSRCDLTEETLFILPRNAGTAIAEPIYVDAELYDNVYFFLKAHLPTQLADLDPVVFYETFERDDTRSYWTGRIFRSADGDYAFHLTAGVYFASPPDMAELDRIRLSLEESFAFPLAYAPQDSGAILRAEAFQNPPFTVLLPESCGDEGCSDPNAFCAVIPEGTELCGHFAEGRDVPGELAAKIRLETVPGSYQIPRQVGTSTLRLFEGGTFGPERTPIDAGAGGLLTVQDIGGYLYYSYTQSMTAGADTIEITWDLDERIYREPYLSESGAHGSINGSQSFPDGRVVLRSCASQGLHLYFAEGQLANGDAFRFSYRHQIPFAGSGPLLLTSADVMLGGQLAEVRDYFQLVYAGAHHNWNNQFVIIFDQPLTYEGHDVHGIWIDEPGTTCCPVDSIHTLDEDFQKLDQLDVTSYLRAP